MRPSPKFSLAKSPFQLRLDKEEAKKTGRFLAFFVLVYLALSFALPLIIPETAIQDFIANTTASFFSGQVSSEENPIVTLTNGARIEISPLCTGITELFIIAAAILASIGIGLRQRLLGALISAIAVFALNILRIIITTAIILWSNSIAVIDFAHNILFRVFLFISIIVLYIAWFYWAVKTQKASAKQNI